MKKDPTKEQEYRQEAERLALLPATDQREIIAIHRSVADNPKVPKPDREESRDLADALERLLKLVPRIRKKA